MSNLHGLLNPILLLGSPYILRTKSTKQGTLGNLTWSKLSKLYEHDTSRLFTSFSFFFFLMNEKGGRGRLCVTHPLGRDHRNTPLLWNV